MPRAPQITRTVTTTQARVLCVDVETGESYRKDIVIPRTCNSYQMLLKRSRKMLENDKVKVVKVEQGEVTRQRYGMTEADFIKHAKLIPTKWENLTEEEENE